MKRRNTRKNKKITARKTSWKLHKKTALLSKYISAAAEKVINTKDAHSDEDTADEAQVGFLEDENEADFDQHSEGEEKPMRILKSIAGDPKSKSSRILADDLDDDDADGDDEQGEPDDECKFITRRKAYRKRPEYAAIDSLFDDLDSFAKRNSKKQKSERHIKYEEEDEDDPIPAAIRGISLLKNQS